MKKPVGTVPENWQRTLFWALFAFTLATTIVSLLGETFKTTLIWYIRLPDLLDLVVNLALYLVSLVTFYELFLQGKSSRRLRTAFLVLAFLYLYGHAMHLGTNAVNTFATEIRKYTDLPADMYALLYFFDETLSHLILDFCQMGLFACLIWLEARHFAGKPAARGQAGALTTGVLFGIWQAIVYTEGQKVFMAPLVAIVLGGLWLWLWRQSRLRFRDYVVNGPVTAFFASMLPCILAGMAIYFISFGSFTEPSKLQINTIQLIPLVIFLTALAIALLVYRFGPTRRSTK